MKEFLDSVAKWFWNVDNVVDSVSHIVLLAVIVALVIAIIVLVVLYKKAHKMTKMYMDRAEVVTAENKALKDHIKEKDEEKAQLLKTIDQYSKEKAVADAAIKQNKEFAKIFKESLIVSKKAASISVDTSNILDALSVEDIKAYAEQIGAKLKSNMTKAEMIKVVRATEIKRKNLEK